MLVNEEAVKKIASMANKLDNSASSHWDGHEGIGREYKLAKDPFDFSNALNDFDVIGPIGAISFKTTLLHKLMHWLLQIPFRTMGARFKTFKQLNKKTGSIAKCQDRAYDGDLMRHTLTMSLLNDKLDMDQDLKLVTVIGDGFANMSSICLLYTSPSPRD